MIIEDYVSFEIAKLLKEKGFDSDEVGCLGGFYSERCYESGYGITTQNGQEVGIVYDDLTNSDLEYDEYLRPTLQMAMKWLREVKNLLITVHYSSLLYSTAPFYWDIEKMECNRRASLSVATSTAMRDYTYHTYEEACEGSIKYCLENLI